MPLHRISYIPFKPSKPSRINKSSPPDPSNNSPPDPNPISRKSTVSIPPRIVPTQISKAFVSPPPPSGSSSKAPPSSRHTTAYRPRTRSRTHLISSNTTTRTHRSVRPNVAPSSNKSKPPSRLSQTQLRLQKTTAQILSPKPIRSTRPAHSVPSTQPTPPISHSSHSSHSSSSNIDEVKINTYTLPIKDYDRARLFYTEALGFLADVWDFEDRISGGLEALFSNKESGISPNGYFLRVEQGDGRGSGNWSQEGVNTWSESQEKKRRGKMGFVKIIVPGLMKHTGGYERVIWVRDEEEKRIVERGVVIAGGDVIRTTERVRKVDEVRRDGGRDSRGRNPSESIARRAKTLVPRTKIQDTEGNVLELRCWGSND